MISRIVPHIVPLHRPALKQVEASGSNKPQEDVYEVRPPGNHEPALADEEQATVEEEQSQLDPGKRRGRKNHGYPDMLECI